MKKVITLITLLSVLILASCSEEDKGSRISAIKIENTLSIGVNKTHSFEVELLPEKTGESVNFSWSSSDESVIAVDNSGKITALKKSEDPVIITVALANYPDIKSECSVIVVEDENGDLDPNAIVEFADRKMAAIMLTYDTNNDGKLQVSEALDITQLVICYNGIASLKGIEYLRNLEVLDCSGNSIVGEVDLSMNKKLKGLYLKNNNIRHLNISNLDKLEALDCSSNRLSEIDVTHNPELKTLRIALNHEGRGDNGSGITELDVTKNPKLETLDLNYTNVSKLDLSQNPKLKWIDFGLTAYTAPGLKPITEIDFSNNTELEHIGCEARVRTYNIDGSLSEDKVGLSELNVSMLPKLQYLSFVGNSIKKIDVSKNPLLTDLNCSRNYLTELDVTNNSNLKTLICEWNEISVLDLSSSSSLEYLNCANNKIANLDISKTKMSYLLGNDNLITEFILGDKVFDTPGGADKKPYLYMKLNNNKITSINLSKQVNLAWLEITDNKLTSLDISGCVGLGGVLFNNNEVSDFKFDNISRIWEIQGMNNKLSGNLDFSHLTLSRLNLEGNPGLENITVWSSFKEDCSGLIIDHTTGKNESRLCYTKDETASWKK